MDLRVLRVCYGFLARHDAARSPVLQQHMGMAQQQQQANPWRETISKAQSYRRPGRSSSRAPPPGAFPWGAALDGCW